MAGKGNTYCMRFGEYNITISINGRPVSMEEYLRTDFSHSTKEKETAEVVEIKTDL